jgi:hypothetical protein
LGKNLQIPVRITASRPLDAAWLPGLVHSPDKSQTPRPRAKCNDGLGVLKGSDSIDNSNFVAKILDVSTHNKMFVYIQVRKQIDLGVAVKLDVERVVCPEFGIGFTAIGHITDQ